VTQRREAGKASILAFWYELTAGMELQVLTTEDHQLITPADVDRIIQRTEWASVCKWENSNFQIIPGMGSASRSQTRMVSIKQ